MSHFNTEVAKLWLFGRAVNRVKDRIWRAQAEGSREVRCEIEFYDLDALISVGYRVNRTQATQFRIWATQTLREFVIKGFVLDAP